MLKAKVGYSTNEKAKEAGIEVANMALEQVEHAKVGIVYTSHFYKQEEVLEGIKEVAPTLPILGSISEEAILVSEGVVTSDHGFVGMLVLDDTDLEVGIAIQEKIEDKREAGRKLALKALENAGKDYAPAYYYMVSSTPEEELYMKGIQDILGNVPVFGGAVQQGSSLFSKDICMADSVGILLFYTDKLMETVFTGAYKKSDNMGIITKMDGDFNIVEIDHEPALQKYATWVGKEVEELKGSCLTDISNMKPFGIKETLGEVIVLHQPLTGNEDNSITVANKVCTSTAVIQMKANQDTFVQAVGKAVEKVNQLVENPGAYLFIHNVRRKKDVVEHLDEIYLTLKSVCQDKPFMMAFTHSEYGYVDHSRNLCGDLMLSFTGFAQEANNDMEFEK